MDNESTPLNSNQLCRVQNYLITKNPLIEPRLTKNLGVF